MESELLPNWLFVALAVVFLGLIAYVVRQFVSSGRIARDPANTARLFHVESGVLASLLREVIVEMKYRVVDSTSEGIDFKTRFSRYSWTGQMMQVIVSPVANGGCEVSITGHRNANPIQVYDWAEPQRIARRIFQALEKRLSSTRGLEPR